MNIAYLWLLIGIVFVALEALGVSGVGMLFIGFGAITAGALVELGLIGAQAYIPQFTVFFLSSVVWTALLVKFFHYARKGKAQGYSNMIGDSAFVGSGGVTRGGGEVTWSGTIMKAELAKHAPVEKLDAGAAVTIVGVQGATVTVMPKE